MKSICFALLFWTGFLLGMRGEEFRTDINPALLYYRALLATEPMSDADRDFLASKQGREQALPERFGKIVAGSNNQFLLVRQAAHAKVPCDWGIDLSPGPNVMLPHLGSARAVCQLAQLRAVWALQHGRQEEARDELLGAFVLGRNAASDGLLISTFVQFAIEGLGIRTVAERFGEFSPESLKQLVNGLDAAPTRHAVASCMPGERSLCDWSLRTILELQKTYPNDDATAMARFRDSGLVTAFDSIGHTNFWPRLVAASGGTSERVVKLLREADTIFPRLSGIMAAPQTEYETEAKQFLVEIQASPNPFIHEFGFVLEKWQNSGFRTKEFRTEAQMAMVRAAVEYRLNGESGLKGVKDPFGNGPFAFRRFVFKGVDRGFELRSAYAGSDAPFVMIFVEKQGPAFQVAGTDAGKALEQ